MAFRNIFLMRLNAFKEELLELSILIYLIKQPWINLWERREKLCTELFNSVVNDENHKIHNLLLSKAVNLHNLRILERLKNFVFRINFRTNRFRNTFIISSLLKD